MNAQELFKSDGQPTGVYYCESCGRINRDKEFVERCCICSVCGKQFDRKKEYSSSHRDCWHVQRRERQLERLEKAELVETDPGPWYSIDGYGRDGYIFDDLEDVLAESVEHPGGWPEYVFCCEEVKPRRLDVGDIVERFSDGMYEDAGSDVVVPQSLAGAVEEFNEANKDFCSYSPDWARKVRVEPMPEDLRSSLTSKADSDDRNP